MCVSSEHAPGALTVVNTDNDDDNGEVAVENEDSEITNVDPLNVFYPEKDWKKIQPGQAIPAGLHVRMNMQTGENEAKLMDGDDGHKYWKIGEKEGKRKTKLVKRQSDLVIRKTNVAKREIDIAKSDTKIAKRETNIAKRETSLLDILRQKGRDL
ncbi:SIL1 [Mytilus coruscus]|uniref:SIL1 n=1 Tax=Mytilus coruscus TaxID=42192 RepID=A0A6J8C132_MYTCO|nr:SIL1 [Mytilus coruscus]